MSGVEWQVEVLRGSDAIGRYLEAPGTEASATEWVSAPAEEPAWTLLRRDTNGAVVKQSELPDQLLVPGGNRLLDTQRRALLVAPNGDSAYYVWDGSAWRAQPAGDVVAALNASREGFVSMLRRLFNGEYPANVHRVHVELFNEERCVPLRVFFYDADWCEVFIETPNGVEYPGPLTGDELDFELSLRAAVPKGPYPADVWGTYVDDTEVLNWVGDSVVEAGRAAFKRTVSASFHGDEVWLLGPIGAHPENVNP